MLKGPDVTLHKDFPVINHPIFFCWGWSFLFPQQKHQLSHMILVLLLSVTIVHWIRIYCLSFFKASVFFFCSPVSCFYLLVCLLFSHHVSSEESTTTFYPPKATISRASEYTSFSSCLPLKVSSSWSLIFHDHIISLVLHSEPITYILINSYPDILTCLGFWSLLPCNKYYLSSCLWHTPSSGCLIREDHHKKVKV